MSNPTSPVLSMIEPEDAHALERERRMEKFLVDILGDGTHTLWLGYSDDCPVIVEIQDYGLDDEGHHEFEVRISDPTDADNRIATEDVVDAVECQKGIIGTIDLPVATQAEYEALKASIANFGVKHPITVNEKGAVIDGRNRQRACDDLGIFCPTTAVTNLSQQRMKQLAYDLDMCRKHASVARRREYARALLRRNPLLSDRKIGEQAGLDHKTIGRIRVATGGETPQVATRLGRDGKMYRHPQITVHNDKELQRARTALKILGDDAPNKPMELRSAERQAREHRLARDREGAIMVPSPADAIQILHGDFRKLKIADASVGLIPTDPPYPKEFLPLWDELGAFAARVLRPGGMLVTYSGVMYLDQVMAALSRHLTFFWQCVLIHGNTRQPLFPCHVYAGYKSILLFSNGEAQPGKWIKDVYQGAGKEKHLHEWQQCVGESMYFVERLSSPGDLIVDPFGGSFTTAEAVLRVGEGRRFVGCDIDKAYVGRGQRRIAEVMKRLEEERAK